MKTILLTGASGFIGTRFINSFSKKYIITSLDTNFFNEKINSYNDRKNFIFKDIRNINKSDLKNINYVNHMAELCNDPLSDLNPELTFDINVEGTKKLLKMSKETGVEKFVYMSSCSVYGDSNEDIVNESSGTRSLTAYSKAKIKNEEFIINNNFDDLEVIILRNATVFGFSSNIRLDLVVNNLVYYGLLNNEITLFSDGSALRPLVHVEDVCGVIDEVLQTKKNLNKEIINNGFDDLNYSVLEIAERVASELNIEKIIKNENNIDKRSYKVDFSKLKSILPYKNKFSLVSGINELINNIQVDSDNLNSFRLKKIENLLESGKLNQELYWT